MIRRFLKIAVAAMALLVPAAAGAQQAEHDFTLPADVWAVYRDRFVEPSGRVVDTGNGNISHSEGQGYGLLLAVAANDRATFEQIWTFTLNELLIREDGLAAWKWDPQASPHVTDINNATDGDILIAWALAQAADKWQSQTYLDAARRIARAIGAVTIRQDGDRTIMLPGAQGFSGGDRPDGPILNLSYWVFEAFPTLQKLAPGIDWTGANRTGLALTVSARFGSVQLPTDWISVPATQPPTPAEGFQPVFGYNSLRIPLDLLGAGHDERSRLETFYRSWKENGGRPAVVDVTNGKVLEVLGEPGYRMQTALIACALDGAAIPDDLKQFQATSYYGSTLHLLAMIVVAKRYPQCL